MEFSHQRHNPNNVGSILIEPPSKLSPTSIHSPRKTTRYRDGQCITSSTQTMEWPMSYDELDDSFGMSVKDIEYLDSDDSSSSDSPDSEGTTTSAVSALDKKTRVSRPKTLDLRREVLVYRTAAPTLPREHLKLRSTRSLEPTPSARDSCKTNGAIKYEKEPSPGRCMATKTGAGSSPALVQTAPVVLQLPKPKQKLRAVRSLDTTLLHKQDNGDNGDDSDHSAKSTGESYSPSPSTKRRFPYLQKLANTMRVGGHHRHHHLSSSSTGSSPSPICESPSDAAVFDDSPFSPSSPNHLTSKSSIDSITSPSSPSVMHRMKLPGSPSQKLNPKKLWRGKGHHHHHHGKLQAGPVLANSFWAPVGNCCWQSVTGRRMQLKSVDIADISEIERRHLQKAAYHRLQAYNVGPIILPRDPLQKRPKKGGLLRSGRQRTSSFLDSLRDMARDNKDANSAPLVFGIALEKCIRNDRELRLYEANKQRERRESLDLAQPLLTPATHNHLTEHSISNSNKLARSISSPSSSRNRNPAANSDSNATLLNALSLSTAAMDECRQMRRKSLAPLEPQVPRLVSQCFRHLEKHGVRVIGIFRVGGSKKRIRQLREDLDVGDPVQLNSSISPHDVGALLKEYFRDLPEPLLTRELYTAFVGTAKLSNSLEQQKEALRLLVYLLPIAHRDTLRALLSFLRTVAMHSADVTDADGHEQQGNKMDSINLATLFGPNILRRTKSGELKGDAADHMEENRDVIHVVQRLIDHHDEMFMVSGEMHDEVLRRLQDMDSEALDYLMNKKLHSLSSEENEEAHTSEAMEARTTEDGSEFHMSHSENILELHECNSLGTDIFESSDDSCLETRKGNNPRAHEWLLRGSVKVSAEVARQKASSLPRAASASARTTASARRNNMLADCDEVTMLDAYTLSEHPDEHCEQGDSKSASVDSSQEQPTGGIEFSAPARTSPSAHRPPPRLVIPQPKGVANSRSPSPKTFRVTSTSPRQRSVSQPPEYGSVKPGSSKKESDIWIPVFEMQPSGLYSPQMPRRSYLERSQWFDNSEVNNNSMGNREPSQEPKPRTSSPSEEVGLKTINTTVTPTHIEWSVSDVGKIRSNSEVSSPPSSAWFTPPSTPDTPRSRDAAEVKGTPPRDTMVGNPGRTSLAMTRTSWDASADDEEWVKRWEFLTSDEDGEFWGQETLV